MAINVLSFGVMAALTALSSSVWAGDSSKYPAYDFQPKVIYQDQSLANSKYPAHHFEPRVVYQDQTAVNSQPNVKLGLMCDSKYPACHFEPKVIYKDKALVN